MISALGIRSRLRAHPQPGTVLRQGTYARTFLARTFEDDARYDHTILLL